MKMAMAHRYLELRLKVGNHTIKVLNEKIRMAKPNKSTFRGSSEEDPRNLLAYRWPYKAENSLARKVAKNDLKIRHTLI